MKTRRQEIAERLYRREWSFDELRHEMGLTVKILEEDLRHIERSARSTSSRLIVRPAECAACGFEFTRKALHPPGRCPKCKDRRIDGPFLSFRV